MNFLTWGRNPWDQPILTHISWDLLWASLFAGVAFLVAHASYMVFSAHRKRHADETDAMEAAHAHLPGRIVRHSLVARMFHWVMASAMFTLLLTAFLPIAGVRFPWVTWHWTAGLVLTASILFHIIHATVWLDFWSIWVGPRDLPELKAEVLRELGHDVPGPRPGKYPLGNRLYHLAIVVAALTVVASGLFMMVRVQTPFLTRNPYIFGDSTWGLVYVSHGIAGVTLVGLVIAHVYFAVRPEKWWITKSMILGWITRRQYLEHHDPDRWAISRSEGSAVP
jgi:cytochrome b subunit of formate dehydrogenase